MSEWIRRSAGLMFAIFLASFSGYIFTANLPPTTRKVLIYIVWISALSSIVLFVTSLLFRQKDFALGVSARMEHSPNAINQAAGRDIHVHNYASPTEDAPVQQEEGSVWPIEYPSLNMHGLGINVIWFNKHSGKWQHARDDDDGVKAVFAVVKNPVPVPGETAMRFKAIYAHLS